MATRISALAVLAALGGATAAAGATITVSTLADNLATDGRVTLREAMLAANTDASVDGSTPGSGADEIVFATGPGTITLNGTPLPAVEGILNITGPGAGVLAVDGARQSRILEVGTDASVTISGLTMRNGQTPGTGWPAGFGGGILNLRGTLTIKNSILSGNAADGIGGGIYTWWLGTVTVQNSVLSGNTAIGSGGGVANEGRLTVMNSTFLGNSAANGGGIYNNSDLTVSDSTFEGNLALGDLPGIGGGALLSEGVAFITASTFSNNSAVSGGAITGTSTGYLSLTNSTLSGNRALVQGGAVWNRDQYTRLVAESCTLTGNRADTADNGLGDGGGISNSGGLVQLRGTIVAGNRSTLGTLSDIAGSVQSSSSYNLVGVDAGLVGISRGTNGNQIRSAALPIDPRLGTLRNNGESPSTHALLAGSLALAQRSAATCNTQAQRGLSRPVDADHAGTATCDIGAYEAFMVASPAASFYTLIPCRLADTRGSPGSSGIPLAANATRFFPVVGPCGVPEGATAIALNITVVNPTASGHFTLYPAGAAAPDTSTVNFGAGLAARAANAVIPLGAGSQIALGCMLAMSDATAHVVLDVSGYFK